MRCKECDHLDRRSGPGWVAAVTAAVACVTLTGAGAQAASVRAWPTAVVVDDEIRVGDLCELHGFDVDAYERVKAIVVASAPKPGGSTLLRLDEIRAALQRDEVNLATVLIKGASRCRVTRPDAMPVPTVTADGEEPTTTAGSTPGRAGRTLREAVAEYFQAEIDRVGGTVNVQFGRTASQVLDLCEPEFEFVVQRKSGRSLGLVNVDVIVQREGRTVQVVPVVVNVSFTKPVVVARRSVNAKAEVTPDDVQVVDITFTQLSQVGVSDAARVVGQRAKVFIAAGETIQSRQLEPVPLVHRGQLVDVHATVGGVRIVTAAKAMQSGAFGEVIELRNAGGKRDTITATVTGSRRVEVRRPGSADDVGKALLADGGGS